MLVIIQIIIAVIVIYLAFSIIVYVITEWIAGILHLRGNTLKKAIEKLFENTPYAEFKEKIFEHPQIEGLKKNGRLPSYIPSNNIAVALIDLVKEKAGNANAEKTLSALNNKVVEAEEVYSLFKAGLRQMDAPPLKAVAGLSSSSPMKKTFLTSVAEQTADLESLTSAIEKWYNNYMDRVSGWYKRNVKVIVLVIGAIVTIGFNVDTIYIIKVAATDPQTRERLNRFADEMVKDSMVNSIVMEQRNDREYYEDYVNDESIQGKDSTTPDMDVDSLVDVNVNKRWDELQKLNQMIYTWELPVGWNIKKDQGWGWTLFGWFLTTLALSAGAPFWFDMLKRIINIRNSGAVPGSKKKE